MYTFAMFFYSLQIKDLLNLATRDVETLLGKLITQDKTKTDIPTQNAHLRVE